MKTISLANLHAAAAHRPPGYAENVLTRAAEVTRTHYTISDEAWVELAAKYRKACIHRGEQVGEEQCQTCAGKVTAKVFACAIHDKCTPFSKPLSVRSCRGCGDHRASVADQASGIEHTSTVDQAAVEGQ